MVTGTWKPFTIWIKSGSLTSPSSSVTNTTLSVSGTRENTAGVDPLSVTGLMDWASQAAPEDLDALSGTVDELVFQTYRGRETLRDIDVYLARLGRLHIPFRLGLAEGASWSPPVGCSGVGLPNELCGWSRW